MIFEGGDSESRCFCALGGGGMIVRSGVRESSQDVVQKHWFSPR